MRDRDKIIKLNSQLYFLDKRFVFWIKFYLLNDFLFRSTYPTQYESLLKEFKSDPKNTESVPLDLDTFLSRDNKDTILKCFDGLLKNHSLIDKDITKDVFNSELVKYHDRKVLGRIVADNQPDDRLRELFLFLIKSIKNNSFYNLSFVEAKQLIGDWISTKETDQLRINYNMTDLMPIGTQVRLLIDKYDDEFCSFQCFAKASDYNNRVAEIEVFQTRIKLMDGYIHHYNASGLSFLYKRPIYDFRNNAFVTQTDRMEFHFERKNNS
jgi:hypothetical protein